MHIKHFLAGILLCSAVAWTSCNGVGSKNKKNSPPDASLILKDTAAYTQVKFVDSAQNFGTVKRGEQVKLKYTVENTGRNPLFIINVQPSCGCTVADFTKTPILPSQTGLIEATFDSNHGSSGDIHKSIVVTTNSKNSPNFVVTFEGKVVD